MKLNTPLFIKPAAEPEPKAPPVDLGPLELKVEEVRTGLANVADSVRKVENSLQTMRQDQASQAADLRNRVEQAMRKHPISFEVKRDGRGLISHVVARPI